VLTAILRDAVLRTAPLEDPFRYDRFRGIDPLDTPRQIVSKWRRLWTVCRSDLNPVSVRRLRAHPPASSPAHREATQLRSARDSLHQGSQGTFTPSIDAMPDTQTGGRDFDRGRLKKLRALVMVYAGISSLPRHASITCRGQAGQHPEP
jgi:hypothetical protein